MILCGDQKLAAVHPQPVEELLLRFLNPVRAWWHSGLVGWMVGGAAAEDWHQSLACAACLLMMTDGSGLTRNFTLVELYRSVPSTPSLAVKYFIATISQRHALRVPCSGASPEVGAQNTSFVGRTVCELFDVLKLGTNFYFVRPLTSLF